MRGVLRRLRKLRIFGGCEFSLEPIKQSVQHKTLTFIDRNAAYALPKSCLEENGAENGL